MRQDIWHAAMAMGGNALFYELRPGERFHFPSSPESVYQKGLGGWFKRASTLPGVTYGKAMRTGRNAAVVKL